MQHRIWQHEDFMYLFMAVGCMAERAGQAGLHPPTCWGVIPRLQPYWMADG